MSGILTSSSKYTPSKTTLRIRAIFQSDHSVKPIAFVNTNAGCKPLERPVVMSETSPHARLITGIAWAGTTCFTGGKSKLIIRAPGY